METKKNFFCKIFKILRYKFCRNIEILYFKRTKCILVDFKLGCEIRFELDSDL